MGTAGGEPARWPLGRAIAAEGGPILNPSIVFFEVVGKLGCRPGSASDSVLKLLGRVLNPLDHSLSSIVAQAADLRRR